MSRVIKIDNYIISEPIINILYSLQRTLTNGKLKDIQPKTDDIVVTCPVHSSGHEANPDLNIYIGEDEKIPYGYARCFACEFKGSFVKFVAACFDSSETYAKQWLIQHYGTIAHDYLNIGENIDLSKNKTKIKKLDESILNRYQNYCPYLAKRKLSREICEIFKVKYDSINRQVVFPVYDAKDNLVMLARRSIDYKMFHMDKDVEKPVYCLNYIIKNNINTCVICEGLIDCLTSYEYGFPAIATLGTVSDYQIEQINKSCLTTVYLMCDNDTAGQRFNSLLKNKLDKRILINEVKLPKNKKDINELTKEEMINCIKIAKNNI